MFRQNRVQIAPDFWGRHPDFWGRNAGARQRSTILNREHINAVANSYDGDALHFVVSDDLDDVITNAFFFSFMNESDRQRGGGGATPDALRLVASVEDGGSVDGPCAICLDPLNTGSQLLKPPCNHVFHATCLNTWYGTSDTCPECRDRLQDHL